MPFNTVFIIPLSMSTMPSLIAQAMLMPESNIVVFFGVISPLLGSL